MALDAATNRVERLKDHIGDGVAVLLSADEWAWCDPVRQTVVFHLAQPVSDEILAHPMFAAVGVTAAHLRGDTPLHAGGFVIDGAAWLVLGEKEDGKSTTMAELSSVGVPILADDLLVVTPQLVAHAGPRAIDLRGSSAARYPEAAEVVDSVMRERFRLPLPPCPPSAPIAGVVSLAWGDAVSVTTVPAMERIARIGAAYGLRDEPASPRTLLDLAQLPFVEVRRPRDLSSLPATIAALQALGR